MKPDNILVDYDVVNGKAVNFEMAIGDWGTAADGVGGTPTYASPLAYGYTNLENEYGESYVNDLFAFGRIALELYLDESGNLFVLDLAQFTIFSILVWYSLAFYPIEDDSMLQHLRQRLSPFLKAIQKCNQNAELHGATRERICDEVIATASSVVGNQLRTELNGLMRRPDQRTRGYQHNALVDATDTNHISRR